jgi:hypothetical protein
MDSLAKIGMCMRSHLLMPMPLATQTRNKILVSLVFLSSAFVCIEVQSSCHDGTFSYLADAFLLFKLKDRGTKI